MSAETLRKAAGLMRERAEAATRTPWGTVTHEFGMANLTINGHSTFLCPDCGTSAETDEQNAEHIASWHPDVALAVALLLENESHAWDAQDAHESDWPDVTVNQARRALLTDVANAYLGES